MIDLTILKDKGITQENLEKKLNRNPMELTASPQTDVDGKLTEEGKIQGLYNRIRSRVQEGMARNFQDWKVYFALDQAWEVPFRQITPTIIQSFISQDPNQAEVYSAFQSWGITNLIEERPDPKDPAKKIKTFNYPLFFNVLVPLVRSYVTIRWAKIMNDRLQNPFFSYEPIKLTAALSVKCEAITDRAQTISTQYGYYDVAKQAVFRMLHYSKCIQFPMEEWHSVETYKRAGPADVAVGKKKADGSPASVGDVLKVTDREGIRYHHPHPTRTFVDIAHPAWTLNYDSGCEYCGHWRISRFKDVANNPKFWNRDKVALGTADFITGNRLFFTSVYSACTLTSLPTTVQPKTADTPNLGAEVGAGIPDNDREKELANQYYGTEHGDQGVLVTEYWERLVPSENGLGDYDCPVWFRFVVAGDNCTILYAAPVPYSPPIYYGYDADEGRSRNASMSLEVLPFQDTFSNLLTQIVLTCKQNLANITFVDEDQLTDTAKNRLENLGEQTFRFLNIFSYSSKKAGRYQNKIPEAVQSFSLPKGNTAEMINVLKTILDVLERVLVMSSQEVAQAATHELRADEVTNIAEATTSRLQFTSTPVDIAFDAWKRQLYSAFMAYGDDDMFVQIPSETPLTQDQLSEMGFTFVDKDTKTVSQNDRYIPVKTTKQATAMPMWAFASTRDGRDRTDKTKMAQALAQVIQVALNNPLTAQAIGPDQAIDLINMLCKFAGMPRDMKLKNVAPPPATPEQQQQAAQEELKQVIAQILPVVHADLQNQLTPLLDVNKQQTMEIDVLFKAMGLNPPPTPNDNQHSAAPTNGSGGQGNPRLAPPPGMPQVPGIPA